jgi:hypothetical protein
MLAERFADGQFKDLLKLGGHFELRGYHPERSRGKTSRPPRYT